MASDDAVPATSTLYGHETVQSMPGRHASLPSSCHYSYLIFFVDLVSSIAAPGRGATDMAVLFQIAVNMPECRVALKMRFLEHDLCVYRVRLHSLLSF